MLHQQRHMQSRYLGHKGYFAVWPLAVLNIYNISKL